MTHNNRRLLSLSFIVFFLIVAPILVMHASGYRFDWKHKRLFQTSVINVNSRPKGADIFLNGNDQRKNTPAILSNILPGTYDIKLEKDGYMPWQNKITVRTSRAIVLYDIVLFRDTPSQLLANMDILQIKNIPSENQVLVVTNNGKKTELQRLQLRDGSVTARLTRPGHIMIETEPLNGAVIISQADIPKAFELVLLDSPNSSVMLDYLPKDISDLQWLNRDTVLGLKGGTLCQASLAKKTITCSLHDITHYYIDNGAIYYITADDQTSYLHRTDSTFVGQSPLARLPLSDNYNLISTDKNHLIITDGFARDIYIIEPNGSTVRQTSVKNTAKDGFWLNGTEQFIYYNDNEIWLYEPKTAEHRLLQRVSETIGQVSQLSNLPYLLFSRANSLEALELNEYSPTRTMTPLVANAQDWFTITSDNTLVYQELSQRARLWTQPLF